MELLRQQLLTADGEKQGEIIEDPIENDFEDEDEDEFEMAPDAAGEEPGPKRRQKTFREKMKITIKLYR